MASYSVASTLVGNSNERELLRRIWADADSKPTMFAAIDTEYGSDYITELGVSTRSKRSPTTGRHIVVASTIGQKRSPKRFSFGLSESVRREIDLRGILDRVFSELRIMADVVVLTGHDVITDINNLTKSCGWTVPSGVIVLDTLHIWRSWTDTIRDGNLRQALHTFGISPASDQPLHNAGNDAWFSLELLARMAEHPVGLPMPAIVPRPENLPTTPTPLKQRRSRRLLGKSPVAPSYEYPLRWVQATFTVGMPVPVTGVKRSFECIDLTSDTSPSPEPPVLVQSRTNKKRRLEGKKEIIDLTDDTPPPMSIPDNATASLCPQGLQSEKCDTGTLEANVYNSGIERLEIRRDKEVTEDPLVREQRQRLAALRWSTEHFQLDRP
ncbi:hypothetical protein QBC46DRAFT_306247 [Diplogelasinospora grovesii]|uniref:Gfd2/YDR514C-like C-terminal domain-containing protein n=1 Tax=Diplogelasinospora grovesii TaxID=303347 RepID=A0AAN6NF69_9PEZI|nr:hypothetical protein QBC46DRAFT_306247 [Diplogelasinospora grovesii]